MRIKSRWYVLSVLTLLYALNFVDRQLVTILAPYIKSDLQISDAQIALLYGTAFALFYGLFGIPLAKLADSWDRVKTLGIGVGFWSLMTAASGGAANFVQLGLARIGVGIGEASATPAAISLLGDYFPKSRRATALAIYSTGLFIGGGISLILGGAIVDWWHTRYSTIADAPWHLAGWQAAFILVGTPGLLLGLLILLTIDEPRRAAGTQLKSAAHPLRTVCTEAGTMFPPWSLLFLYRNAGAAAARRNLLWLAICLGGAALINVWTDGLLAPDKRGVLAAIGPVLITSNTVQWFALAIAIYGTISWASAIKVRSAEAHHIILRSRPLLSMSLAGGFIGVAMYSANSFNFLYAVRYLGFGPSAGVTLGILAAIMGVLGSTSGGILGDRLKAVHPAGRVYLLICTFTVFVVLTAFQYLTASTTAFYLLFALATLFLTTWSGLAQAIGQDVLLPQYRGVGFAIQALATNIIGLGLGPYCVGLISDVTGDLRTALLTVILASLPATLACLWVCARSIAGREAELAVYIGE